MKRVLLLGDSIRGHYQETVKEQLGSSYTVMAPVENCRFSLYTLNSLRFWLEEFSNPDVIHWNNGLWDTAVLYPEDGCFIPLESYLENMRKILRELKKTGAKIIFATTTPVKDEKCDYPGPMPPAHRNEDIRAYNEAILKLFEKENIIINDLYPLVYPRKEELLREDAIHPNEEGIAILGKAVADTIRRVLNDSI